jgi:hypothetical protein
VFRCLRAGLRGQVVVTGRHRVWAALARCREKWGGMVAEACRKAARDTRKIAERTGVLGCDQ